MQKALHIGGQGGMVIARLNAISHQRREFGCGKEIVLQKDDAKTLRTLRNTPKLMVGLPSEDDIWRGQTNTNLVLILKNDLGVFGVFRSVRSVFE